MVGEHSKRVYDYVPDAHFERTSIISTPGRDGFDATLTFKGTLNKGGLRFTCRIILCRLRFGDVVVIDNLSVHMAKGVLQSLFDKGAIVLFLPKYSPDFNPVELFGRK
jgi:hypothetical protein